MLVLGSQSKFLDVDLSVRGGTYFFNMSYLLFYLYLFLTRTNESLTESIELNCCMSLIFFTKYYLGCCLWRIWQISNEAKKILKNDSNSGTWILN